MEKINIQLKDSELVIGLVSPVGVNLEDVKNRIDSHANQFNYKINYVHLSKIVGEYFKDAETTNEHERLTQGMNNGNKLRKKYQRADILSLLAIEKISDSRIPNSEKSPRTIHIIRSLKNPAEVETLRSVYGLGFFLLGISSSNESRIAYLETDKGILNRQSKALH